MWTFLIRQADVPTDCSLIQISRSLYYYEASRFVAKLRGGLVALVYQRSLDIRATEGGEISAVALMGTDIERIATVMEMFHETWACFIDILIACWLLERQLSLACLAPIALVLGAFHARTLASHRPSFYANTLYSLHRHHLANISSYSEGTSCMDRKSARQASRYHSLTRRYQGYQDACITAGGLNSLDQLPNKRNKDIENV